MTPKIMLLFSSSPSSHLLFPRYFSGSTDDVGIRTINEQEAQLKQGLADGTAKTAVSVAI